MYHILKEALKKKKKSATRWIRLNYLVFVAAEFRAQVENTSTSKAEGIEGAPQLWTLPLLEVRSVNKLSGPCQHTLTRRGLPSLRRCPRSGRTPCVVAVTCPELLLSASVFLFCLRVVYVTHAHPETWTALRKKREWVGTTRSVLPSSVLLRGSGPIFAPISVGNSTQWQKILTWLLTSMVRIKELLLSLRAGARFWTTSVARTLPQNKWPSHLPEVFNFFVLSVEFGEERLSVNFQGPCH